MCMTITAFVSMASVSLMAPLHAHAAYPPVCVKMRKEVYRNYAGTMANSWRFTLENNPQKAINDLKAHPLKDPVMQQAMLDMAACMKYWDKGKIQRYILFNHP